VSGVACCGDFITTIQVLYSVHQALSCSRWRLTQYQEIIISVGAIRVLLAHLNLFIWNFPFDIGDSLRHCVSSIAEFAEDFLLEIEGYRTSLSNPGTGSCSRDIRWEEKLGILMNNAAKEFRDKTNRQTTVIGCFLHVANEFVCHAPQSVYLLNLIHIY